MTGAAGEARTDLGPFDDLVRATSPALLRYARTLARDPATAEDLVQETYLRAWRARASYRGDSGPMAWLRRILHNVAVDRLRAGEREDLMDEIERDWRSDTYTVDGDAVVERSLDRAELEDALVHLPFTYRAAVLLHDVEGWTAAEVAETQGISLPFAKQRIRRGRMALVTQLARADARRAALEGVVLRCWDARQLVSDYLDGELDDGQRVAVEAHLAGCPTCPPLYAALVGTHAALGGLRDPDSVVPPHLVARLEAFLAGRHDASAS